jgi:hypothetical protein
MNERQSSVAAHVEVLLSSLALDMDPLYIIISILAGDVLGMARKLFLVIGQELIEWRK